jgi:hypothetical protein
MLKATRVSKNDPHASAFLAVLGISDIHPTFASTAKIATSFIFLSLSISSLCVAAKSLNEERITQLTAFSKSTPKRFSAGWRK